MIVIGLHTSQGVFPPYTSMTTAAGPVPSVDKTLWRNLGQVLSVQYADVREVKH